MKCNQKPTDTMKFKSLQVIYETGIYETCIYETGIHETRIHETGTISLTIKYK